MRCYRRDIGAERENFRGPIRDSTADIDRLTFHASARPGPVCPAYTTTDLPPPLAPLIQAGLALSALRKARCVRACRLPAGLDNYEGRIANKFEQPGGWTQRFTPDPTEIVCSLP
jgi:hypothetical protein